MRRWFLLRADESWGEVLNSTVLLPEPETVLWYSLVFLTAILSFLKGIGVLLLSWWWVFLPTLLPILAVLTLFVVILALKLAEWIIK